MRIELDTVEDPANEGETLAGFMSKVETTYGVAADVVTMSGPGGGHPIVAFDGERAQLERLAREVYDYDDEDIADLMPA